MKLLRQGVLVKIPKFDIATDTGVLEVDFSILFNRVGHKERKKRDKDLRVNIKLLSELQGLLEQDERDEAAVIAVQEKIQKSEDKYDKYLFDDVIGWEGLEDVDKSDVKFTPKNKEAVLDSEPFRNAILSVWRASSGGVTKTAKAEADTKN